MNRLNVGKREKKIECTMNIKNKNKNNINKRLTKNVC